MRAEWAKSEVSGRTFDRETFSDADLDQVILRACQFKDCVFVRSSMNRIRMWLTSFEGCTFDQCSMREAAIGGLAGNSRNHFIGCRFHQVDLSEVASTAAIFGACRFEVCTVRKVDFQWTSFSDCVFGGLLRDVVFSARGFPELSLPPNPMRNVDFSGAELREVEFRCLDLETVRFPDTEHSVLVQQPGMALPRAIAWLSARTDRMSRVAAAYLRHTLKWLGPNQSNAYFDERDFIGLFGRELSRDLRARLLA